MNNEKNSYHQIAKSSSIIGGSQVLNIFTGILRNKIAALLLGPSGIGIVGILTTIIDMARNATGFGINFSAVKFISEAAGTQDTSKISKTIKVLRRWAVGTGILGMLLTITLCVPLSNYSFGNNSWALQIAVLSSILLISSISAAQLALLQGLRMIVKMAKASLYGSILGTLITLPLYWWLGVDGIVPGLILTSLGSLIISWLFARKIEIDNIKISLSETFKSGLNMAKLGLFIVINGFVATASIYYIRVIIMTKSGMDAVGYFQAVVTITTLYINILLNSMLADFFPRLSAVNNDNIVSNKLINEQLEIALLLGTPMLLGMITFSSFVLTTLYSSSFAPAIPVFQWQVAGLFMTLISWPLGVMFLAKNKGLFAVLSETIKQIVFITVIVFFFDHIGLSILGISFFIAALINLMLVVLSVKYLGNFIFSRTNKNYILRGFISILIVLYSSLYIRNILFMYLINISVTLTLSTLYMLKLSTLLNLKEKLLKIFS